MCHPRLVAAGQRPEAVWRSEAGSAGRPADFYVEMLNEADRELHHRKIGTRLVFLIYVDLLWPPERAQIADPERFVLMFAPITRDYTEPFRADIDSDEDNPELPAFVRNRLAFPPTAEDNLTFLAAWQERFGGDSFDFDYHLMWDHYLDLGYMRIAKVLYEDLRRLKDIGLNGFMSCQVQRAFFPTGLPMYIMARVLWNRDAEYDSVCLEYFKAAFGDEGGECRSYLESMSRFFGPAVLSAEHVPEPEKSAAVFANALSVVEKFREFADKIIKTFGRQGEDVRTLSWRYLGLHARFCRLLVEALSLRDSGTKNEALTAWRRAEKFLWQNEPVLHPVADTYMLTRVLKSRLFKENHRE